MNIETLKALTLKHTEIFFSEGEAPGPVVDMLLFDCYVWSSVVNDQSAIVRAIGDGVLPTSGIPLTNGPNLRVFTQEFGDRDLSLRFMAMMQELGLGTIMSGLTSGLSRAEALKLAEEGMIFFNGKGP